MPCLKSILWNSIGILVALLAVAYAYFKWTYQYWKKRSVPHFDPKIPFGSFANPFSKSLGEEVTNMYTKAKERGWKYCGMYGMLTPILLVLDVDTIKNVLTKDFQYFTDRGDYVNEKDDPIGSHLIVLSGSKWRNLRTKLTPAFTIGKLKAMFQTLVDCGLVLEDYIEQSIRPEEPVDIREVLACFSIDVIGSCAFGLDCNSFKEPNSLFRHFGNKVFALTKLRALSLFIRQSFPDLARALRLRQVPKDTADFFTKVVKDTVSYREKNNLVRKDLLQLLMEKRDHKDGQENGRNVPGDGNSLTMNEIVAQSFVFFIAGFETSSASMTFALFELAIHPEIQERLREEINTVLAQNDDKITYDSLSEMKYLGQVIDEALRLHSPARILRRVCINDYKVPGEDLIIEKGTNVYMSIHGVHSDAEYWENPEIFDPERFSEEKKKKMNQYTFLPFGQGPRMCIGERFGMMEMKVALTCLLRKFRVKLDKKTKLPLKISVNNIVVSAEGGIWLNLEKI